MIANPTTGAEVAGPPGETVQEKSERISRLIRESGAVHRPANEVAAPPPAAETPAERPPGNLLEGINGTLPAEVPAPDLHVPSRDALPPEPAPISRADVVPPAAAPRAEETTPPPTETQGTGRVEEPIPPETPEPTAAGAGAGEPPERPPAPPGGGGRPPEEAPEPTPGPIPGGGGEGAPEDLGEIRSQAQAIEQRAQEMREELERIRGLSPEDLSAELQNANVDLSAAAEKFRLFRNTTLARRFQNEMDEAAQRVDILGNRATELRRLGRQVDPRNTTSSQTEAARMRQEVRDNAALSTKYSSMSATEIKTARDQAQSDYDSFDSQLKAADAAGDEPRAKILREEKALAQARLSEAIRIYDKKVPEAETKEKEEKAKANKEEADRLRREQSAPKELEAAINDLKTEIARWETQLKTETDPAKIATLNENLRTARTRLGQEEEALKAARDKARKEAGTNEIRTKENIRKMTIEEFDALSEEDGGKYLNELGKALQQKFKYDSSEFRLTQAEIAANRAVSLEKLATYVDVLGERLITKGGKGVDWKTLNLISSKYPQVEQALAQRLLASDRAKALQERYPSSWKKMMEYAGKHKGWLLIILAILAVGVIGPVTTAVGAAKFAAR